MEAQLQRLVDLGQANDRITTRILPVDVVVADYRLPYFPLSIYTYTYPDPDDPLVVVVDTVTTDLVLTEAEEVGPYDELYNAIRSAALSPSDSLEYLTQAIKHVLGKPRQQAPKKR